MEENKAIKYSDILDELAWEIKNSENLDKCIEVRIDEINNIIKGKKHTLLESNSNLIEEYWKKNIETFAMLKKQGFQIISIPESRQSIVRYKVENFRLDDVVILTFYEECVTTRYNITEYETETWKKEVPFLQILKKVVDKYKISELEYIKHAECSKKIREKVEAICKSFADNTPNNLWIQKTNE